MATAKQLRQAERHLSRVDPVMRATIAGCGPCRIDEYLRRQPLPALYQTIISQQISTAAGASIHRRFKALYGGRAPSAAALLASSDAQLQSAGLSRPKIAYMRDLAGRVVSRRLRLARLTELPDEAVVETLVAVKGIGPWTARVFMIFKLGRLDVLPVGDIGLLDGARVLYDLPERPTDGQLEQLAEPWRPFRSVGCWYLWQGRRRARGERLR